MKIFIKNLSDEIARKELRGLIEDLLKGPWYSLFKPQGNLDSCDILRMTDLEKHETEQHGLVDVSPTKMAWKVVQALNELELNGRPVEARRWVERSEADDRRMGVNQQQNRHERRSREKSDRRRNLEIFRAGAIQTLRVSDDYARAHDSET